MKPRKIKGFLNTPLKTATGKVFPGRFTCQDVQWSGEGAESLITFTITAEELAAAAENQLLWTDQDVQRGIRPEVIPSPARELSVGAGYPDTKLYVFEVPKADDITEKLLRNDKLFLSPLIWNLRPGTFEAYWDEDAASVYLYSGRVYLPDSHHRQQAILKAIRAYKEDKKGYPSFNPNRQFTIELYFLSKEDEGNYFFDKNQRPRPTANSKAYDLTTLDDLSMLAKKVIEKSKALVGNVNRVTDRLTAKNPQVITLSTLREMMKDVTPGSSIDAAEIDGLASVAANFYDLLADVRPELGQLAINPRKMVRETLVVDAAVMMHGYAAIISDFNDSIAEMGIHSATKIWRERLESLRSSKRYRIGRWQGDLFEKKNPLWQRIGVVKPGKGGKRLTVMNTGGARSECGRILRQITSLGSRVKDLSFLVRS